MKSDGFEREREREINQIYGSAGLILFLKKKKKTIYYRLGLGNI